MIHINPRMLAVVIGLALNGVVLPVIAQDGEDVANLSLEDLMQAEVTSVAKKPQRLANAAAAVFVITAEDIRHSGANSLPEVLRLAPGVDATRISGNRWAVSIRGFSQRLANQILVLVDGRNVFNPLFSGVLWEDIQVPLEDIERIEVIRGPGSAVWGTNAVNGVISIITKSAAATQGKLAVVRAGNVEGGYGLARWGGSAQEGNLFYRAYVSAQNANSQQALDGGDGQDDYRNRSAGFRLDGYGGDGSRWDMSGDFFDMESQVASSFQLPGIASGIGVERHRGGSLRARYEKTLSNGSNLQVQGAYVHGDLQVGNLGTDQRDTFDLDIQHHLKVGERHDVVWGGNYRYTKDQVLPSAFIFMNDQAIRLNYYSMFAQDEISLTDTLSLILGLRLDHNPFTNWEHQPTARLSWSVQPNQTLWMAASRSARAPSRGERGFNLNTIGAMAPLPPPYSPTVVPYIFRLQGTDSLVSEELQAYEMGWRSQWTSTVFTDWVVFSHRYDQLRTPGEPTFVPGPSLADPDYLDVYIPIISGGEMTVNGIELTADWRPMSTLRFQLAQTWNDVAEVGEAQVDASGLIPRSITSLRTSWTPNPEINIDLWYRYLSERPSLAITPEYARRGFSSVDLRLAWKPHKDLELSLVGQNLNDDACDAYSGIANPTDYFGSVPTCMPRSVYGQARWEF